MSLKSVTLNFMLLTLSSHLFAKAKRVEDQVERMISTSQLNTLLHLHLKPIDVMVSHDSSGRINLRNGLALRCFQRLSVPHLATQLCP